MLRQVEAGRPVVEAAQNEMLDGVEPDRAQSQGVLDSAADVGQPKVLEEPQDLHILAGPGFAQPGLQDGLDLGLIRFGGHLPRGEYDVDHDGHAGQADAAELHG